MNKIKAAVIGYGNIGHYAVEAMLQEEDFELVGVVDPFIKKAPEGLSHIPFVGKPEELPQKFDVALLCIPTRDVMETGLKYLSQGVRVVDIFDIHGQELLKLYNAFDECAKQHGTASLSASGWDPGADSMIRTIFKIMIPKGITYTNYGPGMSMGHSVAAKGKPGVKDAVSITYPLGAGIHRRMVYVLLEENGDPELVEKAIKEDAYFVRDETHVFFVNSLEDVRDFGHGSMIERKGRSGIHNNQRVKFETHLNNPAVTSQVLVCAARAIMKQAPGAYTMNQVPPVDFLNVSKEDIILTLI
jgi:diaminopimelate dehydrogenase